MRYKILAALVTLVAFVGGYGVGTISGFKTAVYDYVENDAERIEREAASMYNMEPVDGGEGELPEAIRELMENSEASEEQENGTSSRGFQ